MRIRASFDSADTADFAAGDIKKVISPLSTAVAMEVPPINEKSSRNIFAAYNVSSTTPTYSMPTYTPEAFDINGDEYSSDYTRQGHIVEVVCRREEYPAVSKIIVAHGGRNISKL